MSIIPVILCGGLGSRLWPLSTRDYPKPFHKFGMQFSLFQQTLQRCDSSIFSDRPIIVGNQRHGELIDRQLAEISISADKILEPLGRNSCSAVAIACLHALERESDPELLIMPSDQMVETSAAFLEAVCEAKPHTTTNLVTFGIQPESPHSGYGYILPGKAANRKKGSNCFLIDGFIEKPAESDALQLIKTGCLWNSGNFLLRATLFLDELKRLEPDLMEKICLAFNASHCDFGRRHLDADLLADIRAVSIDVAVFEKTNLGVVCAGQFSWKDIGNWNTVAALYEADSFQNATSGQVQLFASSGNLVYSPDHRTALIGIDNIAVVTHGDKILITRRDQAEAVGTFASGFEEATISPSLSPIHDRRPWGEFERIDEGKGYQVKRIKVEPGQSLSLQSHCHRAEHWIIVSGAAEVTVGDRVEHFSMDQSVYIPKGSVHRLSNKGEEPLVLIEVQTGDYFGEDDIVRLDDIYGRNDPV